MNELEETITRLRDGYANHISSWTDSLSVCDQMYSEVMK